MHPGVTDEAFLKDLEENVYCCLKHSSVEGIGVFAIRDIPKDTNPFRGCRKVSWRTIPAEHILNNSRINDDVKELVNRYYVTEHEMMHIPDHGFNDINISYFVNHSENPNMRVEEYDDRIEFFAVRDIEKGEELLADYRMYIDEQAAFIPSQ